MDIIHSPSASGDVGITELTGDVTAGPGGDSQAATLTSTGVAAASYGSATQVGAFTVDAKGRLTAASDVTITPAFASITSKPTTLGGYGVTDAVNTSQLGAANGVATLDSGSKLTSSQLPDIAVTEYLGDSANESAMLALTGEEGDWTTRTDLGTVWIITGSDPSVIGGWTQLSYPTAPVTSVAGKTGAVTLDSSDVGLGNVTNDAQLKIASNLADLDNVTTARDNLGLGTMSTQDANAVAITGGSATGLTSLGVVDNTTLGSSNTDTVTFNARIASEFTPATDNTYDLGRTGHEWRDLYLDGTANIDSLIADTADITGDLTVTGNVGIGTSAPSTFRTKVLEVADTNNAGIVVNGDATNAYASLRLTNSGTSGWDLNYNFPNAGDLGFFDIGAADTRMVIDDSGNLGVGTAAPDSKLHVRNDGTDAILAKFESDIGVNTRDFRIKSPVLDSTTYPFRFTTSNSFAFEVDGVENLRIHSNGNVGVGTTAPTAKLVVAGGGAAIQGNGFPTTGAGWEFYTDTTSGSWAQSYSRTSSAWLDANWNALTHKYSTSGAERMRINSAGDVFIGGTTLNGSENTAGYSVGGASWRVSRNVTTNVNQIVFFNPNGAVGAIQTNGSATSYNTSSDYRLKENVVPMQDALQRITQLKPSRFNFIADDSLVVDGFLAHEVQEVVPEAISGEKDAMRDEEYEVTPAVLDDDGNEITAAVMGTRTVPDYQGIDQSKLVPLLVGAVQELTARLEALENT